MDAWTNLDTTKRLHKFEQVKRGPVFTLSVRLFVFNAIRVKLFDRSSQIFDPWYKGKTTMFTVLFTGLLNFNKLQYNRCLFQNGHCRTLLFSFAETKRNF